MQGCSSDAATIAPAMTEDIPPGGSYAEDPVGPGNDAGLDPCLDLEQCPGDEVDGGSGPEAGEDGGTEAGGPVPPPGYVAGARMLTRVYVYFRSAPNAEAPVIESVAPQGGVNDATHPGQPLGMIPPGQEIELVDPVKSGVFYKVRYDGKVGWLHQAKILLIDTEAHPVDFALRGEVRDILFKRQANHGTFNRDGPSGSSNCGPSSLAMAVRIWGKEKPGLSIEQSIHAARNKSKPGSGDRDSTKQSELADGGRAFGLEVKEHTSPQGASETMDWIDTQLDHKRVVTLAGMTGASVSCCENPNADHNACPGGETAFQEAIRTAQNSPYSFDCFHSIAVIGRTGSGQYVVGDPLSRVGMISMSRASLKDFVSRWGGWANAFYIPQ